MIIMKRFNVLFMVLCYTLCSVSAWSQHTVKGVVKDKETHPVIGASVIIRSLQDTLNHKGCITGENGQFTIEKIKSGKYRIEISFIGYTDYRQEFELDQSLDLGEIVLSENTMLLDEVVVTSSMVKRFADKKEYRLGQRLKELRKAKKWSLRDLEALTDIDNSELSKYEFGFISPQLLSLYKLSQAFGITLSKLLDIEKHGQLLFHCTIIDGTQVTHIKRGNIRANIDTFQEGFVFHHQVGVHLPEQQVTLATET